MANKVQLRGAVKKLFDEFAPGERKAIKEILIDGPRGTGKSRGVAEFLYYALNRYKNLRVLVVRKTRASLTESFIPQWESQVCKRGHPCLIGPSRVHRHSYEFPTRSTLVLGSLEEPERLYSTDWDIVVFQQAEEIAEKQWQDIIPCLRSWNCRVQMAIADCNPGAKTHWLMRRVEEGRMKRYRSRHTDNPQLYKRLPDGTYEITEEGAAYVPKLRELKGVAYQRQYLGEWVTAEGAVWENFDPTWHVIPIRLKDGTHDWQSYGIEGWIGSMDWGFTKPGVLQVWGVVPGKERKIILAAEHYQTSKTVEWWADKAIELGKQFPMETIVADPSLPGNIQMMNDILLRKGVNPIVRGADNKRKGTAGDLAGLDLVRWGLCPGEDGVPRIRIGAGVLQERDDKLFRASFPHSLESEIPLYVYSEDKQGRLLEETDRKAEDHACDALRYAAMYVWKRPVKTQVSPREQYGPHTFAGMFGTPRSIMMEQMARARAEEDEDF